MKDGHGTQWQRNGKAALQGTATGAGRAALAPRARGCRAPSCCLAFSWTQVISWRERLPGVQSWPNLLMLGDLRVSILNSRGPRPPVRQRQWLARLRPPASHLC